MLYVSIIIASGQKDGEGRRKELVKIFFVGSPHANYSNFPNSVSLRAVREGKL